MGNTFLPVSEYGIAGSLDVLNRGFSDYIVPIQLTTDRLYAMSRLDGVDFDASCVAFCEGSPAGIALIALRHDECRLAAMCILPEFRGQGLGRDILDHVLRDSQLRGDRRIVLEVIESNLSAVKLYESRGFQTRRRLISFEIDRPAVVAKEDQPELEEVPVSEVAAIVAVDGNPDLPWQVSAETVCQIRPPSLAMRSGNAYVVISDPASAVIAVLCLVVGSGARRQGAATSLILQLFARFPDKKWRVPATCPEEVGAFFELRGFTRGTLSQLQMERTL